MRVSREKSVESRERIVGTVSRMFRDATSTASESAPNAIMNDAGLTHGGLYGYFGSENDLTADAVKRAPWAPSGVI